MIIMFCVAMIRRIRRHAGAGDHPTEPPAGEGVRQTMRDRRSPIAGGAEPRTLVVIPTYDERATIETVVRGVLAAGPSVHTLIVDDGSPDGTGRIADDLARAEPRVPSSHCPG